MIYLGLKLITHPEYPSPMVDDDADVYAAAFAMLDEAESCLQSSGGGSDLFYGGDAGKWIKLVNTLRMRYHLTVGNYAEALAMDNIIATEADDLQFNYGTQELQLIHVTLSITVIIHLVVLLTTNLHG